MVWHVHDYMDFSVKGQTYPLLRYIRRRVLYALRYHIYGKNACFVPVSLEMAHFVNHFRHHLFTVPKEYIPEKTNVLSERITPLLNGLFLPRLGDLPQRKAKQRSTAFRFLSFGTNFHRKGIATLLAAGKLLSNKKYEFQIGKICAFLFCGKSASLGKDCTANRSGQGFVSQCRLLYFSLPA